MKQQILACLLAGSLVLSGCSAGQFANMAYAVDSVTGMYGMTPEQMELYLSDEAYRIAMASEDAYLLYEDLSGEVLASAEELIALFEDDAYKAIDISSDIAQKVFRLTDLVLASNVIDLDQVIGASDLQTLATRGEAGASVTFLNFLANMSPETIQNVVHVENLKPFYYDVQRYTQEEFGEMFGKVQNITLGDLEAQIHTWQAKATPVMDNLLTKVDIENLISTVMATQDKIQGAMTLDDLLYFVP